MQAHRIETILLPDGTSAVRGLPVANGAEVAEAEWQAARRIPFWGEFVG